MSHWSEQQIELKIQKGIRQVEDDLVIAIEKALNTADYHRDGKDKLEASQFRNLMHVADTTDSTAVIKNFLHYQLGRDNKWGTGENSLAEIIICDINNLLHEKAEEIVKSALKEANNNEQAEQKVNLKGVADKKVNQEELDKKIKKVWIELTRRYLGYGSRHLRYLDKNEGDRHETTKNLKPENNANTNSNLNRPNNSLKANPPKYKR